MVDVLLSHADLDVKITDESNSEPLPTFWNYGHIHPVILARVPTVTVLRRPSTLSGFCRPALRRTGTVHNGGEEVYEIIEVNDIVAAGDPVSPPQYVDMDALAENQSQAPVDSSELHVEGTVAKFGLNIGHSLRYLSSVVFRIDFPHVIQCTTEVREISTEINLFVAVGVFQITCMDLFL